MLVKHVYTGFGKSYIEPEYSYEIQSFSEDGSFLYFLVKENSTPFYLYLYETMYVVKCTKNFTNFNIIIVQKSSLSNNIINSTMINSEKKEVIINKIINSKIKIWTSSIEQNDHAKNVFQKINKGQRKKERQKKREEHIQNELLKKKRQFYKSPRSKPWER